METMNRITPLSRRELLDIRLQKVLGTYDETKPMNPDSRVYFQPPSNLQLKYPCFVYHYENSTPMLADNTVHRFTDRYQVSYLTKKALDTTYVKLLEDPLVSYSSRYVSENIYHNVMSVYY